MMKIAAYVVTLCGAVKAKDYVTLRASRPEVSSYLVPHVTAQANELVVSSLQTCLSALLPDKLKL